MVFQKLRQNNVSRWGSLEESNCLTNHPSSSDSPNPQTFQCDNASDAVLWHSSGQHGYLNLLGFGPSEVS
jgi:hypothetical protein